MQDLYTAVIALGQSIEDIDEFGWMCDRFGKQHGPKCVNGSLTSVLGADEPMFVDELAQQNKWLTRPLRLASVAMIETMPRDIRERLVLAQAEILNGESEGDRNVSVGILSTIAAPGLSDLEHLGRVMACANDVRKAGTDPGETLLTRKGAREWFSRALDLLAKELPEPIQPLTVSDIIGTPIVPTREAMLGVPDDEILI